MVARWAQWEDSFWQRWAADSCRCCLSRSRKLPIPTQCSFSGACIMQRAGAKSTGSFSISIQRWIFAYATAWDIRPWVPCTPRSNGTQKVICAQHSAHVEKFYEMYSLPDILSPFSPLVHGRLTARSHLIKLHGYDKSDGLVSLWSAGHMQFWQRPRAWRSTANIPASAARPSCFSLAARILSRCNPKIDWDACMFLDLRLFILRESDTWKVARSHSSDPVTSFASPRSKCLSAQSLSRSFSPVSLNRSKGETRFELRQKKSCSNFWNSVLEVCAFPSHSGSTFDSCQTCTSPAAVSSHPSQCYQIVDETPMSFFFSSISQRPKKSIGRWPHTRKGPKQLPSCIFS